MTRFDAAALTPDQRDVRTAHDALPHIKAYLARHHARDVVRLVADGGDEPLEVPRAAIELLARILTHMAAGQGVSIVPANAELTTQQAAAMLNVSRPFLIKLLNDGKIEYRTVGTHRRVLAESLRDYMRAEAQRMSDVASELTALNQEMGLT
ncbi:helix-turn-helix domain-containing protein [Labedaea rhizosphaerae]|uniref:Excisionase family DNA binding protein n=1 Tax=Labedaea rhizosphaerae TaxID=598644 RepID=A0A4R6S3U4_LABRH|nr:helix-turn-helix domain-containing protein [Labedaea rhizosphaerae]TDP93953.1 excisionase family DNA binding protein [Labedaea rhizosphaerae]